MTGKVDEVKRKHLLRANPASDSDQNSLSIRHVGVLWVNPAPVLRVTTLAAKPLVTRLKQVCKSGGGPSSQAEVTNYNKFHKVSVKKLQLQIIQCVLH